MNRMTERVRSKKLALSVYSSNLHSVEYRIAHSLMRKRLLQDDSVGDRRSDHGRICGNKNHRDRDVSANLSDRINARSLVEPLVNSDDVGTPLGCHSDCLRLARGDVGGPVSTFPQLVRDRHCEDGVILDYQSMHGIRFQVPVGDLRFASTMPLLNLLQLFA